MAPLSNHEYTTKEKCLGLIRAEYTLSLSLSPSLSFSLSLSSLLLKIRWLFRFAILFQILITKNSKDENSVKEIKIKRLDCFHHTYYPLTKSLLHFKN